MEMSDGLGSDSEAGCSDSDDDDDNNETSYTIDSLNDLDHCSDVISQGNSVCDSIKYLYNIVLY